jgi:hypothetical protein
VLFSCYSLADKEASKQALHFMFEKLPKVNSNSSQQQQSIYFATQHTTVQQHNARKTSESKQVALYWTVSRKNNSLSGIGTTQRKDKQHKTTPHNMNTS